MMLGEAIVSGCDASPVLQLTEHPVDDVATLVGCAVERVWWAPQARRGNGRFDLPLLQPSAQAMGIMRPNPPARALTSRRRQAKGPKVQRLIRARALTNNLAMPASGGAYFALTMERRLWRGLPPFPRRPS